MFRSIKSESLKLKKSLAIYLILTFSLLELLTILPYLWLIPQGISIENLAFLTMLALPILISLLVILAFEQEKQANQFQELRSFKSKVTIWLAKLLTLDLFLIFPTGFFWLMTGRGSCSLIVVLAFFSLSLFLVHFHFLLGLFIGKAGNIIIAFVECLFILFASNSVFLKTYWLPQALPVNFILRSDGSYLLAILFWIVLVSVIYLILAKRKYSND